MVSQRRIKSTDEKVGLSQKEESDLTERWIFAVTISTDCIYSSTVALYIISMKPLELMKQGGQLPRPKPPVEQRVKVMDTLDKKMQTILDREDLSADERLKLYDHSFTRYLNVYDNYRPRPVAVAPEPVKQDLFDDEILENVPKIMKAKAQLLLKKMKSSPDISWNEKGELKYKGETVQGSNVVD
jgi:hypothetical protein